MNIFVNILFAHCCGDYICQNNYLALNKSKNSLVCAAHCAIYTFFVLLLTKFDWVWAIFIFGTHFAIDRFSLADLYLKLIRGCSLTDFIKNGQKLSIYKVDSLDLNYRILRGGITAFVYIVVDNSIHIFGNYYFFMWWFGKNI